MKGKHWLIGWLFITCLGLGILGGWVYKVDPYMHFHKPDIERYYYSLDNQRSQNDGITKHFDYDTLITGTSMAENFKTSEMDALFACNSIKVCYSGGSYKEMNDNLKIATEYNPNLKRVVRGLDMSNFLSDKDLMREDLGTYPTYLYDANPLNDVKYLFNRDVIWKRIYSMMIAKNTEGFNPGITSFDAYSRWQSACTFGINTVCKNGIAEITKGEPVHLTDSEREAIQENIIQNVTSLAKANPDITFYYFFTPYSIVWWGNKVSDGTIYRHLEAEEYIIKLILECENIKLFSFNNRIDIVADLNNYKDITHYGGWINSLILQWMHDGEYLITEDNYKEYLNTELDTYLNYDYYSLNGQIDYENDLYAGLLLKEETTGATPIRLELSTDDMQLMGAVIVEDQHNGNAGIECVGSLKRANGSGSVPVLDYILNNDEYVGAKVNVSSVDDYDYLVFYGRKISNHGQPSVYVINDAGEQIGALALNYHNIDNEWHQYIVDITLAKGNISIIFNGGYIDYTGSPDSKYVFSDIMLY